MFSRADLVYGTGTRQTEVCLHRNACDLLTELQGNSGMLMSCMSESCKGRIQSWI